LEPLFCQLPAMQELLIAEKDVRGQGNDFFFLSGPTAIAAASSG
jgi:hypothetical protein